MEEINQIKSKQTLTRQHTLIFPPAYRTGARHLKIPPRSHKMGPSAAAARCLQQAHTTPLIRTQGCRQR